METGLSWWVRNGARVGVWIGRKGKSRVHNISRGEKDRMTKRAKVTGFIFWTMVVAVAFSIIAVIVHAIETPTTDPNPAEMAGIFAPIVALCTAFMALSQAANGRSLRIRPKPGIYIGGGSVICAYLWIVDESGNHLFDPDVAAHTFCVSCYISAGCPCNIIASPAGQHAISRPTVSGR